MKTIFVVEDQAVNLKLIKGILELSGYEVLSAESADEGMPMIRELQPDLVLMDIQMPGTDGLTATRLLKRDQATQHIPVIALTACAMDGDKETILAAGCDDYAAKPIQYKQILTMIEMHLERESHEE